MEPPQRHGNRLIVTYDIGKEKVSSMLSHPGILNDYPNVMQVIGCSSAGYEQTTDLLSKLTDQGLKEFFLFPGKISQFLASLRYADNLGGVIIPKLLNSQNRLVNFKVWLGEKLVEVLGRNKDCLPLKVGYVVMDRASTVGRESQSTDLTENEVFALVEAHLRDNPDTFGICLENGSGADSPISEELVKSIKSLIYEYENIYGRSIELLVFGGIKEASQAARYHSLGATIVGISSVLEAESSSESRATLESFLAIC